MFDEFLKVDKIFVSIQGESSLVGRLTLFIRFYGCNIGCKYCDEPQDRQFIRVMTIDSIMERVHKENIKYICLTGGEPMLQWDGVYPLVLELVSEGYKVSIETSGCIPIDADPYDRSFIYIMDVKTPSSGVAKKNVLSNLSVLHKIDEVKFVIADKKDYNFMLKTLKENKTHAQILISPCFDKDRKIVVNVGDLIKWMACDSLFDFRVQIQLHKLLNIK